MYTSESVCLHFRKSFESVVKSTTVDEYEKAWTHGLSNKTKFYEDFYSKVSKEMGCKIKYERFRCDSTIVDENGFPLVLIETENAHTTASMEIEQLCGIVAPVKVLALSCEWADGERDTWLPKWQSIIKSYNDAFPTYSRFCIVVGEWGRKITNDNTLRYYFLSISSNGEIIDDLEWEIANKK